MRVAGVYRTVRVTNVPILCRPRAFTVIILVLGWALYPQRHLLAAGDTASAASAERPVIGGLAPLGSTPHPHVAWLLKALHVSQSASLGPKIYVYPTPEDNPYAHVDCVQQHVIGSSNRWEALLGVQLAKLPNIHTDPATADLFMVANNFTCYLSWLSNKLMSSSNPTANSSSEEHMSFNAARKAAKQQVYERYLRPHILQVKRSPYFQRRSGADHAMPFAGDMGLCSAFSELGAEPLGAMLRITMYSMDESRPAAAVNEHWPSSAHCYTPGHDILVPPYSLEAQHRLEHGDWRQRNAPALHANRPRLAYFSGAVSPRTAKPGEPPTLEYAGGMRMMLSLMTGDERNAQQGLSLHIPSLASDQRRAVINSSLFCLCPGGHAPWTPRPYECLAAGSLPVHLTDGNEQPFERYIPYRSISMKVAQGNIAALARLLQHWLDTHGEQELGRRVALAYDVLPFLLWSGDPRVSATAMVVLELACRYHWVSDQHAAAQRMYCRGGSAHRSVAFDDWL